MFFPSYRRTFKGKLADIGLSSSTVEGWMMLSRHCCMVYTRTQRAEEACYVLIMGLFKSLQCSSSSPGPKLLGMDIHLHLIIYVLTFLTGRHQAVRVNSHLSFNTTLSIGAPQGSTASSPSTQTAAGARNWRCHSSNTGCYSTPSWIGGSRPHWSIL